MSTLKPCPNCGSVLVRLVKKNGKRKYECDAGCRTQTRLFWTEEEAREAWNALKKDEVQE